MRIVFIVGVLLVGFASAGHADVASYCEAYAIDFANLSEKDDVEWQERRDDARAACLLQYRDAPVVAKVRAKRVTPATVVQKKPLKPKTAKAEPVKTKVAAKTEEAAIKPVAEQKKPDIKEGTPAWYDYCSRKYASFSRKTGKYQSRSGVERKCLVTADFE